MFKEKDRVKHLRTGYVGTVTQVYSTGEILVDFDNKDVLPCKLMAHEYTLLLFAHQNVCVRCGGLLEEVVLFTSTVYDCKTCNVKRNEDREKSNQASTSKL